MSKRRLHAVIEDEDMVDTQATMVGHPVRQHVRRDAAHRRDAQAVPRRAGARVRQRWFDGVDARARIGDEGTKDGGAVGSWGDDVAVAKCGVVARGDRHGAGETSLERRVAE